MNKSKSNSLFIIPFIFVATNVLAAWLTVLSADWLSDCLFACMSVRSFIRLAVSLFFVVVQKHLNELVVHAHTLQVMIWVSLMYLCTSPIQLHKHHSLIHVKHLKGFLQSLFINIHICSYERTPTHTHPNKRVLF